MTVELIQGLLLAFALVVILMPSYIRLLRAAGMGKRIRAEGPEAHLSKGGTPTMGGLLVILVVIGLFYLLRGFPQRAIIAPLATLLLVGGLGAVDDFLNARTGEGIRARHKMLWLVVVAAVVAFQIQSTYSIDEVAVPFIGAVGIAPWVFVVFAAFAIIASSNGVNLTDGLDGLAGGTLIFAFVAFLLIALLNVVPQPDGTLGNQPNLAFLCASGSLALGATLAVIALISGQILVLPLIGLVFVIETASDIIQIGVYKITKGRRVFKMAPLHHHFELSGWDEEKITLRFWIVGILAGLLGVTLFLASIDQLQ